MAAKQNPRRSDHGEDTANFGGNPHKIRQKFVDSTEATTRRVGGKLVKETFGEMPVKKTREEPMKTWSALKPKAAAHDVVTLDIAIERYLEEKPLAEKTKSNYKYNCARAVIDTLVVDRAAQRLMKLASTEMCSVRSQHGGATGVFASRPDGVNQQLAKQVWASI